MPSRLSDFVLRSPAGVWRKVGGGDHVSVGGYCTFDGGGAPRLIPQSRTMHTRTMHTRHRATTAGLIARLTRVLLGSCLIITSPTLLQHVKLKHESVQRLPDDFSLQSVL